MAAVPAILNQPPAYQPPPRPVKSEPVQPQQQQLNPDHANIVPNENKPEVSLPLTSSQETSSNTNKGTYEKKSSNLIWHLNFLSFLLSCILD